MGIEGYQIGEVIELTGVQEDLVVYNADPSYNLVSFDITFTGIEGGFGTSTNNSNSDNSPESTKDDTEED